MRLVKSISQKLCLFSLKIKTLLRMILCTKFARIFLHASCGKKLLLTKIFYSRFYFHLFCLFDTNTRVESPIQDAVITIET